MGKSLCFASPKGGSGKTVITASLGRALAELGFSVVMIDTDAATNGLSLLFLEEINRAKVESSQPMRGIYEIGISELPASVALTENLSLVPASYLFFNTEEADRETYSSVLPGVVRHFEEVSDFVLVDAQAGSDQFAAIALSRKVTGEVVIVSEFDPISTAGVERLKVLFPQDLGSNRSWILINKMLPEFISSFRSFFQVARYAPPLPWDADVVKAFSRRETPLDMEAPNTFTIALLESASQMLGREVRARLQEWRKTRTNDLREPLVNLADQIERELDSVVRGRIGLEQKTAKLSDIYQNLNLIGLVASTLGIAMAFVSVFAVSSVRSFIVPWITGLGIAGVLSIYILSWSRLRSKRKDETDTLAALESLRTREEYLRERFKQLRALADADLELLAAERQVKE